MRPRGGAHSSFGGESQSWTSLPSIDARMSRAAAAPAPAPAGPGAQQMADLLGMAYRLEPANNMRKTIARRLSEAKHTVPHFYLTVDCELDALLGLRKELNARGEKSGSSAACFSSFCVSSGSISLLIFSP